MIQLDPGVDYRVADRRGEAFLAYYEAMLHTGELMQQFRLVDWIIDSETDDPEERVERKLWASFLWGATYNLIGMWTIMREFPTPPKYNDLAVWYNANFDRMRFDTDCRYRKSKMLACYASYLAMFGRSQSEVMSQAVGCHEHRAFRQLWSMSSSVAYFGRLACWNHVEAVAYGMRSEPGWHDAVDAPDLMLQDISGSESNRNGVAWVCGLESLATHHGKTEQGARLKQGEVGLLINEAEQLWHRSRDHLLLTVPNPPTMMNYETALCWAKKMMSRTRQSRYLGWDGDRTWEEIKYLEQHWPEVDVAPLWKARDACVPRTLLCEHYPEGWHRGVDKDRMRSFYETGRLPEVMAWQQGVTCEREAWLP